MTDDIRPGFEPPAFHVAPAATHDEPATTKSSKSARNRNGLLVASAVGIAAVGFAGTAFAANAAPTPTPTSPSSSSTIDGQAPAQGPDGDNDGPGMGAQGGPGQGPQGGPGGGPDGGPGGGWGRHGGGMRGPGMGPGIHGTFVTPDKAGTGYQTIDTQKGSVTDVSPTSITVKSKDGFTKTYVVTSTTDVNGKAGDIATVKTGDDVAILGIESGSDVNAQQIFDGKNFKPGDNGKPGTNGKADHNWQPGQNGNNPPAPNGSTGASGGGPAASPSTSG